MAEKDREKWDLRYQEDPGDLSPSPVVRRYICLAAGGKALDLACGTGRNSLFLAEKGFRVEAVDISRMAIDRVSGLHPGITARCLDLDTWEIPENEYELILNIRFLDRRLFPGITAGLKPGGVLIFESFTGEEEDRFCLTKNELLHAFSDLDRIHYDETKLEGEGRFKGTACFVGVKAVHKAG
ncbi:MAG: methyltransferase domain-containing protein [Desulfobacula sp.]|nr:methyltransferase domain-containing protein [Desulfobacula sp.]